MRAQFINVWALGVLGLVGCTQTVTPPSLQSLAGSEQVSLLCRDSETGEGRDARACPDADEAIADGEKRHTMALVTQGFRGEVAVVDLSTEAVLDADPWLPGKEFLPVGARPAAIVSTPGGVASFVAVAEVGLEAIYALPTTCITAPPDTANGDAERRRARELTLWSSCRLPGRPGRLAVVTDPTPAGSGGFSEVRSDYRTACAESVQNMGWDPNGAGRTDCPADLTVEEGIAPAGRRKLLVTLPDQGLVATYDAQAILNLDPGSFDACVPDSVIRLSNHVPKIPANHDQALPTDWPDVERPVYDLAVPGGTETMAAGIALAGHDLYVADIGVPLVHVIDLSDPCAPAERDPLRPVDFDDPTRVVLTSEVAVSEPTLGGQAKHQRFLYAVDYEGARTVDFGRIVESRSIMAFDLSDGASKLPIVRSHVPDLPFESPDRIRFESPVKKLQIVSHDVPAIDPETKTARVGERCNPYPDENAGALYRTSEGYSKGAGPKKLRGIFGVATLSTGQLAAVDIEDWDAPCRRPMWNNPRPGSKDWLGCEHDATLASKGFVAFSSNDQATVSDEFSCNVFEPHRLRSGRYFRTDSALGTFAPSLTASPRLSSPDTGDLPTGKSDVGLRHPQLLAVHYADNSDACGSDATASRSFVNIGSTRYEQCLQGESAIDTNPGDADTNTLILPLNEPRVYASQEAFTVTFEGAVIPERSNGRLPRYSADEAAKWYGRALREDEILLQDENAWFCTSGVEDIRIARETGATSFGLTDPEQLDRFALRHADFVSFTSDFDSSDPYWAQAAKSSSAEGAYCPDVQDPYKSCINWFGTKKEPKATRDFIVRESQNDDLVIVPKEQANPAEWVKRAHCCFRNVASYEVRAGKQWVVKGGTVLTRMRGGGKDTPCYKDFGSRRRKLRSRVFEIASSSSQCVASNQDATNGSTCAIGAAMPSVVEVCLTEESSRGVSPNQFGTAQLPADCLFDSLKGRFAIYRGRQPSERDMTFRWTVTGGFLPMSTTIASATVGFNVLPSDMVYSESLKAFVIVDESSGGLNLIDLATFAPLGQPYL